MRRLAAAVALASGLLVGCGDNGESLEPIEVELTAIDYAFEGVPTDEIAVGSTLLLTNDSSAEVHEVVAVLLPDDEERPASELVTLPEPDLMALLGGVATVVVAAPDDDGLAVVGDGTLTEPGRYLLLCVIPTGADPAEYLAAAATSEGPPDVAGGAPHVAHGMWAELTVIDPKEQ